MPNNKKHHNKQLDSYEIKHDKKTNTIVAHYQSHNEKYLCMQNKQSSNIITNISY